ncbi:MAG: PspC domain-containing protein [Patescibacteria group bacterium]|nr:PspC domain-containing protein [Patescibacteria group bacterium]
MKYLVRDPQHKMIAGVLAGLGHYFEVDPTLLRVFYIFLTVITGFVPGILIYFFAALVMPLKAE